MRIMVVVLLCLFSTGVQARCKCDGFNGCRCGVTAARYNGLPLVYNGINLKQAIGFVRAFPRTSFGSGVIAYFRRGGPTGHVATVVAGGDCRSATVHDDRGTYQRNVCGATFVSPRGAPAIHYDNSPRHVAGGIADHESYGSAQFVPSRKSAHRDMRNGLAFVYPTGAQAVYADHTPP